FGEVKKNYSKIFATHLSSDAKNLYEINFTENIALVFGNEHSGISEELLPLCHGNFIIPQAGIIQSLNISVACAVTLYEAYRQKKNAGHYQQPSLPLQRMNELMMLWGYETLEDEKQ
ncbi:MAG TPA: TrmH family RNA methyltransferase, partial [Chitinophagaceae bacterium]|nr:TrmH family RNA methyltransferase [Chitinophagaceae bacterium]